MTYELDKLENRQALSIGMVSCVGFHGLTFPAHRGNYFEMCVDDNVFNGYEIANFWYEDLEDLKHLINKGVVKFPITIKLLEDRWEIIHDPQIPEEYYSETSYRAPDKYKSVTQRAKKQLNIDTGKVKLIKDEQGRVVGESQEIKSTRRTLSMKYSASSKEDMNCSFVLGDSFKIPSK